MRNSKLVIVALALMAVGATYAYGTLPGVDMTRTNAVRLFQVPGPGVDHLYFTIWDTIEVPNVGTDTVELRGSYVVQRNEPTTRVWGTARMAIDMLDLNVQGSSGTLGRVTVRLNQPATGYVNTATGISSTDPAECEVFGLVRITLHDLGLTVFNKEAVRLSHSITHIPPIGQGGGSPVMRLPLYSVDDPDGAPVAYLLKVNTQIGGYIN